MRGPKTTVSARLAHAVERRFGVHLQVALATRLNECVHELEASQGLGEAEVVSRVMHGPEHDAVVSRVRQAVSIGETYFFRAPAQLHRLEELLKKQVVAPRRQRGLLSLRAWSAACSTGEEAYTLAILLKRVAPDFACTVIGTDMNEASLQVAREGVYGGRSFRQLAPEVLQKHFRRNPNGHVVLDELKSAVTFFTHNLVVDQQPRPELDRFDLIVCRNVLIYLSAAEIPGVMKRLCERANPTSVLMLTPAEYSAGRFATGFRDFSTGILVRESGSAAQRAEVGARQWRTPPSTPPPTPRPSAPAPPPFDVGGALRAARRAADGGSLGEAREQLAEVLHREPDSALARYLLAEIAMARGDAEAAIQEYRRSLYLQRGLVAAEMGLGLALVQVGKKQEGGRHLARVQHRLEAIADGTLIEGLEQTAVVARGVTSHALAQLGEDA